MKLDLYLTAYIRIYSKWIQDLKLELDYRTKTIQLSENIEINLYDF